MIYNFKEYKLIFDTPAKKEQEQVVAYKIMDLINKKKYDDLSDFSKRIPTYQQFIKNNDLSNVVKHFGNTLNEEDFKRIINNLDVLTKTKQDFEKENIKTTNIREKQFNSYKGEEKSYFLDNSNTTKSLEEQMKDLQPTSESFQTADMKTNTENMFKELEKNKKEGLNLYYLNEINIDNLNEEEKEKFDIALNYQLESGQIIKFDVKKGVIVDKDDNITLIEKIDDQYVLSNGNENENENVDNKEMDVPSKQLVLKPSKSTIYSNN